MAISYTIVNGILPDYYAILKIERTVSSEVVKKAYYLQAKTWHPDRNPEKKAEYENHFKLIGEAYDILSNPHERARYDIDLRNYERLANSNRNSSTAPKTESFFSNNQFPRNPPPHPSTPPFTTSDQPNSNFSKKQNSTSNTSQTFSSNSTPNYSKETPSKPSRVVHALHVSLDELYLGAEKKMRISRTFLNGAKSQDILIINVTPGWEEGRKITLKFKGDEYKPGLFQDIVFELVPKPHSFFKLIGNELELEVNLSLVESLCGFTRKLPHFGEQVVSYHTKKCTGQGHVTKIPEGGMPLLDNPSKYRDLILRFNVQLPDELTPHQIEAITKLFP